MRKVNEAPEKIILSADRDTQIIKDEWVINDYTDNIKIEYVRTDAFIEKACEWLESVNLDYYQIREGVFSRELVVDFRKTMEE